MAISIFSSHFTLSTQLIITIKIFIELLLIKVYIFAGDILAKDFDCNFREVAAADQVNEVRHAFNELSILLRTLSMLLIKLSTLLPDRRCFS